MSKYVIKQFYPSLPDTFLPGTILFRYTPIVGFAYYSDMHDQQRLKIEEVENYPQFFERVEYPFENMIGYKKVIEDDREEYVAVMKEK